MLRKSILAVATVGACALPGMVLAEEAAAPSPITGNFTLASDYVFRGVSQTMGNPAVQGGFDYAHSSGFYVGTWASNISGIQYTNANMEWDFYGGYTGKISDDFSFNVGGIYVMYPDGVTGPAPNKKWNTTELYGGVTWKWINLKASYSLTNWYGIGKDGGFVPTEIDTGASSADDAATRTIPRARFTWRPTQVTSCPGNSCCWDTSDIRISRITRNSAIPIGSSEYRKISPDSMSRLLTPTRMRRNTIFTT